MSAISLHRGVDLLAFSRNGSRITRPRISSFSTIKMQHQTSPTKKMEELSVKVAKQPSIIPQVQTSRPSDLRFDRLQTSDQELKVGEKLEFGNFVARDAMVDEEYWTAAWLRAESNWEGKPSERYIDTYKRKFAEQEFNAIKRRCKGQHWQKCRCIVTAKKEDKNIKRTILKSIVGTLDYSIRYLLHGESVPGELGKPLFCSINNISTDMKKYGYISNLCVSKSARRQSIARNMMTFAIEAARSDGIEQVYVHVLKNNVPAKELYQKMGFKMVDLPSSEILEEPTDLLCLKT